MAGTILPKLIEGVNTNPEYAALRRVYLARVAAEWFRVRQGERPTSLGKVIGSGDVGPWAMPPGWARWMSTTRTCIDQDR